MVCVPSMKSSEICPVLVISNSRLISQVQVVVNSNPNENITCHGGYVFAKSKAGISISKDALFTNSEDGPDVSTTAKSPQ